MLACDTANSFICNTRAFIPNPPNDPRRPDQISPKPARFSRLRMATRLQARKCKLLKAHGWIVLLHVPICCMGETYAGRLSTDYEAKAQGLSHLAASDRIGDLFAQQEWARGQYGRVIHAHHGA